MTLLALPIVINVMGNRENQKLTPMIDLYMKPTAMQKTRTAWVMQGDVCIKPSTTPSTLPSPKRGKNDDEPAIIIPGLSSALTQDIATSRPPKNQRLNNGHA